MSIIGLDYEDPLDEAVELLRQRREQLDECKAQLRREEISHDNTITRAERAEELADKLAYLVAVKFGSDFGEHSNANCPITNAIEYLQDNDFIMVRKSD